MQAIFIILLIVTSIFAKEEVDLPKEALDCIVELKPAYLRINSYSGQCLKLHKLEEADNVDEWYTKNQECLEGKKKADTAAMEVIERCDQISESLSDTQKRLAEILLYKSLKDSEGW